MGRGDVHDHQVIVGPAGHDIQPFAKECRGQRAGVVDDLLGIGRELGPQGLGEGDRLGGHDVGQGASQHHRAPAVDGVRELGGRQHEAATRPAQGLVRRRRHDVGVRDRIELIPEHLPRDQAREVGHVDHQHRADFVGDLAHPGVIDVARIGAEAGQEDQRPDLDRLPLDDVVVEQVGLAVDRVAVRLEHLARRIEPIAVRQVSARGQVQAEQALAAQCLANRPPLFRGRLVPVAGGGRIRTSAEQFGDCARARPWPARSPRTRRGSHRLRCAAGHTHAPRRRVPWHADWPGPRSNRCCHIRHRTGDAGITLRTLVGQEVATHAHWVASDE